MKILIFGATGNIGTQTLDIIKKDNHELVGISFNNNVKLAKKICNQFNVKYCYSPKNLELSNVDSYNQLIIKSKPNLIINAISGYQGLQISILAIKNKINLALANKETLVMAGKFINLLAKKNKVKIYPIDSEHSSIYDVIVNSNKDIKNIIITCSGGKFYHFTKKELAKVELKQALTHPNWTMGNKITIDSATLMNKCFEIVEAYWLFNTKNIIALYHPQSIVHGGIEFVDNSYFFNASIPDMKQAIALALNRFKSTKPYISELSFANLMLNFDYLDMNKFKPIKWAYDVINDNNNSLGIIINVSNDIAVNKFMNSQIKFNEIINIIEKNIKKFCNEKITNLNQIANLIKKIEEFNH